MVDAIAKKLGEAGYKLLGDDDKIEELILDILNSKDIRYLKAIPFLLYKYGADYVNIYKKTDQKELFKVIAGYSKDIFSEFHIEKLVPNLIGLNEKLEKEYATKLSYGEFKNEFEIQLRSENKPFLLLDKQKVYEERDLQMNLSKLFTKKERDILYCLLADKPISKTDYEYFSRKTKKKLNSIIGLHELALTLYSKNPKYDKSLFELKGKLEFLLKKETKDKISILDYSVAEGDKISINYRKQNDMSQFNTIKLLAEIEDKGLLKLITVYNKHNFR